MLQSEWWCIYLEEPADDAVELKKCSRQLAALDN